jgi:hypothetical protein
MTRHLLTGLLRGGHGHCLEEAVRITREVADALD